MVKWLVVLAGMMQQAAAPPATPPAPVVVAEKAELCAVVGSGHSYFGHYLEVTGVVTGEKPDHLMLVAPECPAGLPLGFAAGVLENEDVKTLFLALQGGAGREIKVDVEGSLLFSETGAIVRLQVDRVDQLTYPKR